MRIYISGPITGVPDYRTKFDDMEVRLTKMGYDAFNPAKVDDYLPKNMSYEEIMSIDLAMLDMCNAILLLDGWQHSKGAKIELTKAMEKGLLIYIQTGDMPPALPF